MSLPLLYSFRRCPYAIRARLAIAYSRITVELREVVLRDKPESLIELSAKATVPVLLTTDNQVIDESLEIMFWALKQHDADNWYRDPASVQMRLGWELVRHNDDAFKMSLDRYKYFDRYPEQERDAYLQDCEVYLQRLERQLTESTYLIDDNITWVDIAVFPFIRQFAYADKPRFDSLPYPHVQQWLHGLLNSDLFTSVMLKYPQWQDGDTPQRFP